MTMMTDTDYLKQARDVWNSTNSTTQPFWSQRLEATIGHILSHLEQQEKEMAAKKQWTIADHNKMMTGLEYMTATDPILPITPSDDPRISLMVDNAHNEGYALGRAAGVKEEKKRIVDLLRVVAKSYKNRTIDMPFNCYGEINKIASVLESGF